MSMIQIDNVLPGTNVNVKRLLGDQFNHDFTGHVTGTNGNLITVQDQDGDCWDCEISQLSFSRDEIMHS